MQDSQETKVPETETTNQNFTTFPTKRPDWPESAIFKTIPSEVAMKITRAKLPEFWQKPSRKAAHVVDFCACCSRQMVLRACCLCSRCYDALTDLTGHRLLARVLELASAEELPAITRQNDVRQTIRGMVLPGRVPSPPAGEGQGEGASEFQPDMSTMSQAIISECADITAMLLQKNQAYGDSAANPVRIFSKASPIEQINIRIDDKLSRLLRGHEYPGDDTELDLIGYLILKRSIQRRNRTTEGTEKR